MKSSENLRFSVDFRGNGNNANPMKWSNTLKQFVLSVTDTYTIKPLSRRENLHLILLTNEAYTCGFTN